MAKCTVFLVGTGGMDNSRFKRGGLLVGRATKPLFVLHTIGGTAQCATLSALGWVKARLYAPKPII